MKTEGDTAFITYTICRLNYNFCLATNTNRPNNFGGKSLLLVSNEIFIKNFHDEITFVMFTTHEMDVIKEKQPSETKTFHFIIHIFIANVGIKSFI